MRFRKLRIAFSFACLLACLVAVAILVRNRHSSQPVPVVPNSETEVEVDFVDPLPAWDEIATVEIANYSQIGSEGLRGAPRATLDESGWLKLERSFRTGKQERVQVSLPMIGLVRIIKRDDTKIVVDLFGDGGVIFRVSSGQGGTPGPYFRTQDSRPILQLLPTQ